MHPISYVEAVVLGLLQGATELFVVFSRPQRDRPRVLGWAIHQTDDWS